MRRASREAARIRDGDAQLALVFQQAILLRLARGDVRADGNVTAGAGGALADEKPAAVLELRLVGTGFLVGIRLAVDLDDDARFLRLGHHILVAHAAAGGRVAQAVEGAIFRIAEHEVVVFIPEHEGLEMLSIASRSRISARSLSRLPRARR